MVEDVYIEGAALEFSWADPKRSLTELIFCTVTKAVEDAGGSYDGIDSVVLAVAQTLACHRAMAQVQVLQQTGCHIGGHHPATAPGIEPQLQPFALEAVGLAARQALGCRLAKTLLQRQWPVGLVGDVAEAVVVMAKPAAGLNRVEFLRCKHGQSWAAGRPQPLPCGVVCSLVPGWGGRRAGRAARRTASAGQAHGIGMRRAAAHRPSRAGDPAGRQDGQVDGLFDVQAGRQAGRQAHQQAHRKAGNRAATQAGADRQAHLNTWPGPLGAGRQPRGGRSSRLTGWLRQPAAGAKAQGLRPAAGKCQANRP